MRKYIGIIGRPDKNITNKDVYIISKNLNDIVLDNDFIPLGILPNVKDYKNRLNKNQIFDLYNTLSKCSGIILQGGDKYYDYDKVALKYAIKNNIPILGICLGMQVMASLEENNLVDINLNKYNNHNVESSYVHDIVIDKNSKLYNIIGKEKIKVNSTHKERIKSSGIYKISAYSPDGIIEAIEYNENDFNIGVQFHPERLYKDSNVAKIFKAFFDTIKRNYD